MKNNNNHPKTTPTIQNNFSKFLLLFLVIPIISITIIISLFSLLILILHQSHYLIFPLFQQQQQQHNIISQNGKTTLMQIGIFTYRNHSLYRYRANSLLTEKNENIDEEDEGFVMASNIDNIENNVRVMTMSPYSDNNNDLKVQCEGTCECYWGRGNSDDRRGIGNVIYSYRFVSIVVVSFLGYATARFVDEHIDECYDNAVKFVGDVGGKRNEFLTCSMENAKCDTDGESINKINEGDRMKREVQRYECTGHCEYKKKFCNKEYLRALWSAGLKCRDKFARPTVIEVTEDDYVPTSTMSDKIYLIYQRTAKEKYRKLVLTPFCKTFINTYLDYDKKRETLTDIWLDQKPCKATMRNMKNIKCKKVGPDYVVPDEEEEEPGEEVESYEHLFPDANYQCD